ncbi:MAG: hypothetical protein BZ135_01910 [Methanosphaera sp. rholeuAM6]|nr:MAG: hypothetical protein BZ135_01910 [Methanosphaera sp. rholeuAM6]
MKRIHMIGILLLLIIIAGAYIMSPFSPMNKVSVNGETIKLTSGYIVKNSSGNSLTISNDTNEINIYPTKLTTDLEAAIAGYKEQFDDKYEIQTTKLNDANLEIIKTEAVEIDGTKNETITKYWFVKDGTTYNMQTMNAVDGTDDVVKNIVSSMN